MSEQKLIDFINQSLKGKKIKHRNSHSREVTLEVENVSARSHHKQITADTKENDYWGESCEWDTVEISFVDGSKIELNLNDKIEIIP